METQATVTKTMANSLMGATASPVIRTGGAAIGAVILTFTTRPTTITNGQPSAGTAIISTRILAITICTAAATMTATNVIKNYNIHSAAGSSGGFFV